MPCFIIDVRANYRYGVFRYGISLAKELLPLLAHRGDRVYLLCEDNRTAEVTAHLGSALIPRSVTLIPVPDFPFIRDEPDLRNWAKSVKCDVYYSTNYVVDPELEVPLFITIHDLIRFTSAGNTYTDQQFASAFGPETLQRLVRHHGRLFSHGKTGTQGYTFQAYFEELTRRLIQKASLVATVSRYSASRIKYFEPTANNKLRVVPGGVDKTVFRPPEDPARRRNLSVYGLSTVPFCLYTGADKPHKRLPEFNRTFAQFIP
jgi:hypothetical protein